jgi:dihydroflavonol-4-reductase
LSTFSAISFQIECKHEAHNNSSATTNNATLLITTFAYMILVTGGTGFLGAYLLVDLVRQGKPVRAMKREQSSTKYTEKIFDLKFGKEGKEMFAKINWVNGDIMDVYSVEEAMQGIEEVYHCATEVSLRDEDPDEIILTAEKGTANMVNIALEQKVKKFCHVSSVSALGENDLGKPITEEAFDEFDNPDSPYAIGKHLAEAQVWRAHAEGLNVSVVCPTIIMGPWPGKKGSMSFFHYMKRSPKFYTTGTMGFVDVHDVVAIMERLMNENKMNERYLVNGENISYHSLFTDINASMGIKGPSIKITKPILKVFRIINNIFGKFKMTGTMIDHSSGQFIYSNKKVCEALNYKFIPVKQSIAEMGNFMINGTTK